MRISEAHCSGELAVSFELFPPRDAEADERLFGRALPEMAKLAPAFLTCTYGAGGSTREQTLDVVTRTMAQTGLEVASHLTCVGASRAEIAGYLEQARQAGVTNIVALRGDPPASEAGFEVPNDGFAYASELVAFIRTQGDFDIAVAGYPEGHPTAPDKYFDWRCCRDKVEAGASMIITQLFYNIYDFYEFDDYLKNKLGLTVPVVPGILPILSGAQIKRFCGLCGATVPREIEKRLADLEGDKAGSRAYGVELATRMCEDLIRHGVPGFHFYSLNRVESTREVLHNLKLAVV